jgi:hypothetical protein
MRGRRMRRVAVEREQAIWKLGAFGDVIERRGK